VKGASLPMTLRSSFVLDRKRLIRRWEVDDCDCLDRNGVEGSRSCDVYRGIVGGPAVFFKESRHAKTKKRWPGSGYVLRGIADAQ